jgi:hypothetical protein
VELPTYSAVEIASRRFAPSSTFSATFLLDGRTTNAYTAATSRHPTGAQIATSFHLRSKTMDCCATRASSAAESAMINAQTSP